MAYDDFVAAIKLAVDDLLTLDVITLTGNVEVDFKQLSEKKKGISNLCNNMIDNFAASGNPTTAKKAEFVAMTHLEIDADSLMYVKQNPDKQDEALISAHNEAVKAAMEARCGMVETLARLLNIPLN